MSTRRGSTPKCLENALSTGAQHPEAMGVVDHQPRLTAILDLDQRGQVADVAVHAVKALGDDQNPVVLAPDGCKRPIERLHVVMGEGASLASGHDGAHDDAVMGKRIMKHEIPRSEQRPDRRDIGRMPAHKGQTAALPVVLRQGALEGAVDGPLAGDETACRGGDAIAIDRVPGGAPDSRTVVESEVIIRGEVDERPVAYGGCRAGVGVVNQKIGVPKPEGRGGGTQHALFRLAGQGREIEPGRIVGLQVRALRPRPGTLALSRAGSNHAVQKLTVGLCQALRHTIPLGLTKFAPFQTRPAPNNDFVSNKPCRRIEDERRGAVMR